MEFSAIGQILSSRHGGPAAQRVEVIKGYEKLCHKAVVLARPRHSVVCTWTQFGLGLLHVTFSAHRDSVYDLPGLAQLLFQPGRPIEDHGERDDASRAERGGEQEALAVRRKVPTRVCRSRRSGEQSLGRTGLESLTSVDIDGHHLAIQTEVEQLFPIGPPDGTDSAAFGNQPLRSRARGSLRCERPDIAFSGTRFRRGISQPTFVRRYPRGAFPVNWVCNSETGLALSANGKTQMSGPVLAPVLWNSRKRPSLVQGLKVFGSSVFKSSFSSPEPSEGLM